MRKLRFLLLLCTLLILASFSGDNDVVKIWIQQTSINKVLDFEKELSDKVEFINIKITLSKSIYPFVDKYKMAKPVIAQRRQAGFLPLYAEYFFSEPDSILRYVSYDWEREKYGNLFKKKEMWNEEGKKLKEYNTEYERIKSGLIAQIGEPVTQDKKPKKTKSSSGRGDYLSRNTVWETEDYYSELNMIFESMTYRIRWNYYWKK